MLALDQISRTFRTFSWRDEAARRMDKGQSRGCGSGGGCGSVVSAERALSASMIGRRVCGLGSASGRRTIPRARVLARRRKTAAEAQRGQARAVEHKGASQYYPVALEAEAAGCAGRAETNPLPSTNEGGL